MPILLAASYISGPLHQRSITTASTLDTPSHLAGRPLQAGGGGVDPGPGRGPGARVEGEGPGASVVPGRVVRVAEIHPVKLLGNSIWRLKNCTLKYFAMNWIIAYSLITDI